MVKALVFILIIHTAMMPVMANRRPTLSVQETLNNMAVEANTIFKGRILRHQVISDGLIFENGDALDVGIIEFEVLKSYRGTTRKHDRQIVCSWLMKGIDNYYGQEMVFAIGQEFTVFGLKVDDHHVLETSPHGSLKIVEDESILYKAMKLKHKKITDPFVWMWPDSKIKHNACIESKAH